IQYHTLIFGPKNSWKFLETDNLFDIQLTTAQRIDNRSLMIDQKQFTIDIRPNFNETNQVDYESICRFQADRSTLFLFIIENTTDGRIDAESIYYI
ncbi:unnamed protein product, partial [Rotaria magnacalcarata]